MVKCKSFQQEMNNLLTGKSTNFTKTAFIGAFLLTKVDFINNFFQDLCALQELLTKIGNSAFNFRFFVFDFRFFVVLKL